MNRSAAGLLAVSSWLALLSGCTATSNDRFHTAPERPAVRATVEALLCPTGFLNDNPKSKLVYRNGSDWAYGEDARGYSIGIASSADAVAWQFARRIRGFRDVERIGEIEFDLRDRCTVSLARAHTSPAGVTVIDERLIWTVEHVPESASEGDVALAISFEVRHRKSILPSKPTSGLVLGLEDASASGVSAAREPRQIIHVPRDAGALLGSALTRLQGDQPVVVVLTLR